MAVDLQLKGLTIAQKMLLLEQIWDDICQEKSELRSPEWHAALLEERKRKLADGTMPVSSWIEAKERLLNLGQ